MEKPYDVVIIGGGPIGLACGIEAQKRNLTYTIIEKGCLVNSIYHYPANMTFFSTSEKIEIGEVPFVSHTPRPSRREALEYYRRVQKSWKLEVRTYEEVTGMDRIANGYRVTSTKGTYDAQAVIIATGFYDLPNLMKIPGEDLPKVKHYYDEAHPYIDKDVVVVGGANSAIDVALETWRKGARVTLVVRQPEISHRVKYWIRPDIENRIKEGSIQVHYNSTLAAIRASEVDVQTPEGIQTLPNDFVLAMTGYHPNFEWLTHMGIELEDDPACLPVRNVDTFESNLPNVYLTGTVCGGKKTSKWFIENSIEHAAIVMEHIAGRKILVG